jgi:beta-glucanase (GH16 family)
MMRTRTSIALFLVGILALPVVSCRKSGSDNTITGPPASTDTIPPVPGWTLVWNDEFNGPDIDAAKWEWEVNGDGGGNNELQYYTGFPENSFIEDGKLVIKAIKENYLGKHYTSARMRTKNKGDWRYGRFEARMKLPYGKGMWPAFWMLPTDWVYGGWPQSGEIDIMELVGDVPNKVYGTIHWGDPDHRQSGGSYVLPSGTFAGDFHTFIVEWDSVGFRWYVDGLQYFSTSRGWPFDQRFHILLNLAVGGNWPGNPDEFTYFPQLMYVDYVRVYRSSH